MTSIKTFLMDFRGHKGHHVLCPDADDDPWDLRRMHIEGRLAHLTI